MWMQDVKGGIQFLKSRPSFTLVAVLTLGLGIGATSAIFTVVNSVVLRPLPFPDSARVVGLCETNPRVGDWCGASPANVADWARASRTLESAGVARSEPFIARDATGSYGVRGGVASPGFFHVLKLQPLVGRIFNDADLPRGANHIAIVSYGFWQRRLGADPGAVGRTLTVDDQAYTVVGVLPADAFVPQLASIDLWKPLTASMDDTSNRNWRGFVAIGRLAPGATRQALGRELEVLRAGLAAAYPESNAAWGLRVADLRAEVVGPADSVLWLFLGAVGFVLLIACANVAGLLLVQGTRRMPEFAVRAALGASRLRLWRQLITEGLVLSAAGGSIGLLLAAWITRGFVLVAPSTIPRLAEVSVDMRVAIFAALLSAATAVLFSTAPAWQASKADVAHALVGLQRGGTNAARRRSVLVVAELALAFVLLSGAGLLTRAFGNLLNWDPGFDRQGVAVSWLLAPMSTYKTSDAAVAVLERARDELAATPGVRSIGLASAGPLFGGVETGSLAIEGQPPMAGEPPAVHWFDVDPGYFDVLGIRQVAGRRLTPTDRASAPPVAVVNEAFARRFFPDAAVIGQRVTVMKHPAEIVGVVADVRPARPDAPAPPEIYWPIRQYPRWAAYLVLRLAPEARDVEAVMRTRLARIDPNLQITSPLAMDELFSRTLVSPRFNTILVGMFALLAVALAAVGVAGVMAFSVASRTREIGLRTALGASPRQLVWEFMRQGLTLATMGSVLGLIGTWAVTGVLGSLLYGLPRYDPVALSGSVVGFALVTFVACYVPARRASRVDPIRALRAD